jgi:hypothetical protein
MPSEGLKVLNSLGEVPFEACCCINDGLDPDPKSPFLLRKLPTANEDKFLVHRERSIQLTVK